jgi:hypothetical protein
MDKTCMMALSKSWFSDTGESSQSPEIQAAA